MVGVVKDVPVNSLYETRPVIYQPMRGTGLVLVRDRSRAVVDRIASVARGIEPGATVSARPLDDDIREATQGAAAAQRFAWAIGVTALLLSAVGAFGVFAYAVEERRREIGVRLALGAEAGQIVWSVVAGARWPLGLGLGIGFVASMAVAPVMSRFLLGLSPFDPVTYAAVSGILIVAALGATWRAVRIDPAVTLRAD